MRENGVQALLMGGQACILYGAAEFSRDADFAILASPENLGRLTEALAELQAEVIAVPPFEMHYLTEERRERDLDRLYWEPLKSELESLRHRRGREV
jgi:hypothetical protein